MSDREMMKSTKLFFYGLAIFLITLFVSINFAGLIGPGSGGEGYVVTAVSILIAVVSVCTMILYAKLEEIQKHMKKN